MSKFKVFPDKLKNEVNDFEEYEKTLFRIQQEINSIKNNLGFKISSSNYIGGRLRSIVDDVFKESVSMNVLAGSLSEICSNYSDTEKRICGENDEIFDYVGCIYPEGVIDSSNMLFSIEIPLKKNILSVFKTKRKWILERNF